MVERVKEYVSTLSVEDKTGYENRITDCVEFFDSKGITEPTESDLQQCAEYLTADGTRSANTVKVKYIPAVRKFYRWCVSQDTQQVVPDDTATGETPTDTAMKPDKAEPDANTVKTEEKQPAKDKLVRINFLLDEKRYKKLAILAVLEDTSLTAILRAGADLYIKEHETQAAIAEQAINDSDSKRSE